MFGRWSRKQRLQLPDLDSEVAAHWKPEAASAQPPAAKQPGDSLEPILAPADYSRKRTRERSRRRRRIVLSLLIGSVLGSAFVGAAYYLMYYINPAARALEPLGQRMAFGMSGDEEIFYTEDIGPAQARQLGEFLQREGIFTGHSPKSVRVSKNGAVCVVGFVVEWDTWKSPEALEFFRELQERLSREVFAAQPVEIHLCARQADSKGRLMPAMHILPAGGEH